jgi:hypothetical protein
MTEQEAAALDALRAYALAVRRCEASVDASPGPLRTTEYFDALIALEAAESALLAVAEALLPTSPGEAERSSERLSEAP